jgi:hypothetical protein
MINIFFVLSFIVSVFLRNWLIKNAKRISENKSTVSVIKAFAESLSDKEIFLLFPILKKTNVDRSDLFLHYSNLLLIVIYSVLLTLIVNLLVN